MRLLKFEASWCGPCQKMKPVVAKIAEAHGLEVETIDIDVDQQRTLQYGVQSVPTLVLLEDDEEKARLIGAKPQSIAEKLLGLA